MIYRVTVPSDRTEDRTTENRQQAYGWCLDLSVEFGYAEVSENICGPKPILCSYTNGN